jgi:transcriptional regulator with XRE-family HTH domain
MTKIERVKKVCKWLIFYGFAENDKELAEKLGYSKSSFSQIMNEKVPLSNKFIDNLCSANKNLNKIWIEKSEGTLFTNLENDTYLNYKNLAEARQEIIDGLKYKIDILERENRELRIQRGYPRN